jgi:hypothetical protein
MNDDAVFTITAHIDLLGFSSHMQMASNDLRTEIGKEAVKRLGILEEAIKLFEIEKDESIGFYPEGLRWFRFNDSIILNIDIVEYIMPPIGKSHVNSSYSFKELNGLFKYAPEAKGYMELIDFTKGAEALRVGKFIGLTARIHNYINSKEDEMSMPGCRTIIASGLRYRTYDRKEQEDYYSANFSLANAHIANEKGSGSGFVGNNIYMDDSVAHICNHDDYVKKLIGYTKFVFDETKNDPYSGVTMSSMIFDTWKFTVSSPFTVKLFGTDYSFRMLNPLVLSNFQNISKYKSEIEAALISGFPKDNLLDSLCKDTPTLIQIQEAKFSILRNYPFLLLACSLEEKISSAVS